MRKLLYLMVLVTVSLSVHALPVEQLSQNGFKINNMSLIYRGVRYPMKQTTDGEFAIDLGCRIDTGAVDIVFIVDNTGSMGGTIAGVRSNINGFISELDSRGYDYRLGGVEYGDLVGPSGGRREYDSTGTIPGAQMTSQFWGDFQTWVNGISAWGGADAPENALCAIEAGMNDYDWRPDALHILIFFTDASYYECGMYGCDGTCSYCDEDVANDILAGGFVLFASTSTSPYSSYCAVPGGTAYNWYRNTATSSGGHWYSLGTSWGTIFDDVVALIDTFEVINFCVTNNSGTTINPATATVYPGACISVLSSNPQNYGPWYNGEEHCFVWRINTIEGCTGVDACFTATVSGGGFADTATGCVFLEDCDCPGPDAEPVCPPCDYPFVACPYQEITIHLWDEDSWVNTSTITLNINGVDYHFPDHLSYASEILTFTPDTPWAHGTTVHYTLSGAQDGMGCPMISSIDCGFIVDLRPPQITNWQPPCGIQLEDSLNVSFDISDDVSGINLANTYFTVNGTMYNGASPYVSYSGGYDAGTFTLSGSLDDFGLGTAESVVVCFYAEDNVPANMDGCNLCGPNDTTVCCTYYLNSPPTAEFIIPDSASWVACDPAEIYILFHDPDGDPIDSMSLLLEVWTSSDPTHITYDITDPYFNMYDETTAVFSPPTGYFSSGDTVYAQLVAGSDLRGAPIDTLPIFWMFYTDYDPPVYFGHYPPPDTVVYEFPSDILVNIIDSLSGLDETSIQVTVNGEIYAFTWGYNADSSVWLDIPISMEICSAASETCAVQVCVYSADSPDTCGPNDTTDCWNFYWVFGAPWAEIRFPDPYSIVACEDSTVEMVIHGGVGPVDTMSIAITIDNGDSVDTFYITDDWLYITYVEGDTAGAVDTVLVFAPPAGYWQDADTYTVSLIYMNDIYGFPASGLPMTWVFFTDFSPPVTYNHQPPDSSVVPTATPDISFTIEDSVAGLNPDSFFVVVTDTCGSLSYVDTFTTMDYPVAWDGHNFQIIASMADYSFEDGDTVWVCVEAMQDTPTYCGPNDTSNCWYFVISVNVPSAQWVQYAPNSYVACVPETVIATITDPDGIDPTTLEFWVIRDSAETTMYDWSDGYFTFANDTLIFVPPTPWGDGDTIDVCIAHIEDSLGNPMPEPYCWSFIMDEVPPSLVFNFPPDGAIYPMQWAGLFEGHFVDLGSGLDTSSFFVVLCGDTFRYPRAGITVSEGDSAGSVRFTVDPNLLMPDGEWRACSLVCMGLSDQPDYCGPNDSVYCWTYILTPGPRAEIITPQDGQITSCADQCILIHLWDEDLPVDTLSIVLEINGDTIDWASGLLSYEGETLSYCPPGSLLWSDEEVVHVRLLAATDSVGAELQDTLSWAFAVDLSAPDTGDVAPSPGDTISYGTPPLCFDLTDNLSGVNWDSVQIAIDGSVFVGVDTPAVEVSGASVCVYPESLGLRWVGGDSIQVCVSAEDSPDLCAPNETTYCWVIYVEPGGPYGAILHPFMGAWVSCEDTGIVMNLYDEDGVVDSTIEISIQVGSSAVPETIDYPDPRLSWDPSTGTLIYHHPTEFGDADTVWVCILYAEDPIGNPLSPRPVCSYFYMDRYSPTLEGFAPAEGSVEYTRNPRIWFEIYDSLSGLDTGSVQVELNGVAYGGGCLDITDLGGGLWHFEIDTSCYEFSGCDTVLVHITSTDTTDYCDDNELDTSFAFSIDCEGPRGEPVYVPPEAVSSCDGDSIVLWLWDSLPGVDPSTIVLYVSGYDTIRWGDPGLVYHGDTLVWYPSPPLPEEGEIHVVLVAAEDSLGNGLESPVEWRFYVDRIAPQAVAWSPGCGDTVGSTHPPISIEPYDSGCGVVTESTFVVVNGDTFTYADGLVHDVGGRLEFHPDEAGLSFPGGSSVEVCWHLVDCADDICPPNAVDTCCEFYVESGGPWSDITGPCESDWVGCSAETVHIAFEDEDGVVGSSIEFEVCYGASCDSCETLNVSSSGVIGYTEYADSVVFDYVVDIPTEVLTDGDMVCVHTLYAEDSLGNPITDHGRVDSFYVMLDLTPPEAGEIAPEPMGTVSVGNPVICVGLSDGHSGLDEGSIVLTVNGVDYSSGATGFSWDGTRACFDPSEAGIYWAGGENVNVCIHAQDASCACPNVLDSCWYFVIQPGGPVAEIVHPENGIVSACEGESIVVNLYDPQEDNIVDSTIQVLIYRSSTGDTQVIDLSDPQLVWDETSGHLAFYPEPHFGEAETVYFCVISAEDTLHNPMTDTTCVEFSMDLGSYVAWNFVPAQNGTVSTRTPTISVCISDSVTGIADSSIVLRVDGVSYTLDSSALMWADETTLVFVPESAGVFWSGGDCIDISLYAYDQPTPGYCEPNDSTVEWQICIAPGGPVGEIVRPFNGAISSCPDEHIIMTVTDSDGVDPFTIRLVVNGDTFSVNDPELEYHDDTLWFYPHPSFVNGETVHVCLVAADDSLGNPLSGPVCWSFVMDLTPPWSEMTEPTVGMVRDRQQDIAILVGDSISGVDYNSIQFFVNDVPYPVNELVWTPDDSIQGGAIRFIPENFGLVFPPGESVCVHITATDSTDYCDDNILDTTYCFLIEPEVSCRVHPNPFTPDGDNVNEFAVFDYPYMFSEDAELQIYDLRNVLVYKRHINHISEISDFLSRSWDGKDLNGNPLPEGLYLWIIISNGEVVCNGTVVLAR